MGEAKRVTYFHVKIHGSSSQLFTPPKKKKKKFIEAFVYYLKEQVDRIAMYHSPVGKFKYAYTIVTSITFSHEEENFS